MRRMEMEAMRDLFYSQLTEKVGDLRTAQVTDPTTAVVSYRPFAGKAAKFAKDMASEFVLDSGGIKEAAGRVLDTFGAGKKSAVMDKAMEVLGGIAEAFAERKG
ncbi:MAG: hypothetical protein R3F43_31610 [bacterium]